MSVTLEQCALLRDEHQLSKDFFIRALDCMRRWDNLSVKHSTHTASHSSQFVFIHALSMGCFTYWCLTVKLITKHGNSSHALVWFISAVWHDDDTRCYASDLSCQALQWVWTFMAQTKKISQVHKCFTVKCCAYSFFLPRQANSHLRNKVSHLKMNFNAKYSQQSDAAPESHFEAVKIQVTCLVKKGKTKRRNKQTWAENVVTDYDGIFCKLHTILLLLKKKWQQTFVSELSSSQPLSSLL